MFESTLSAQGLSASPRRFGPLTAAIFGHLAIVSAIVGVTALIVPPVAVPDPPDPFVIVTVLRPPDLGLEKPRTREPKRGMERAKPNPSIAPQPPMQPPAPPVDTPSTLPTPTDAPAPDDGPHGPGDGTSSLGSGPGPGLGDGDGDGGSDDDGTGSGPTVLTGDMIKPELLVKVEPSYPNVARIARLGGRVVVKAVIGLDGRVESAELFASSSPLFNHAARDAVLKWRYRPALMNGRPVRVYFTVVVEFSVR